MRKVTTQNGPNPSQKPSVREGRGRGHQQPANHPYSRTPTAIRRESMKPYMSQPMLGLQRSSMDTDPYQHSHPDSDMSSSASPDPSPSRLNSDFPLPITKGRLSEDSRRHSRRLSLHSLASQPIDEISTQVTIPQPKGIDGLPRQSLSISTSEGMFVNQAFLTPVAHLVQPRRQGTYTSYSPAQIRTASHSQVKA